MTTQLGY